MNATVVSLTARQLLSQKRTALIVVAALLPVLMAAAYRASSNDDDALHWTATVLLGQLVAGTLLPLAALIFGTAALGTEFEDGTAVYLLSKPIPRRTIVASKLLVAWLATLGAALLATIAGGVTGLWGEGGADIVTGFCVAVAAGSLMYVSAFLWLSIVTSRALIVGLLYAFIWEGVVSRLFDGVRFLSIRQFTLGIAGLVMDVPRDVFDPRLDGAVAVLLAIATVAGTVILAVRALRDWEVGESA